MTRLHRIPERRGLILKKLLVLSLYQIIVITLSTILIACARARFVYARACADRFPRAAGPLSRARQARNKIAAASAAYSNLVNKSDLVVIALRLNFIDMFFPCPNLQRFVKAFPYGVVPRVSSRGVVHCTHRTTIPRRMVRNDIFFNI